MKLKKGVDPIGTRHHIPAMTQNGIAKPIYKVTRVIGGSAFLPQEVVLVELAYDDIRTDLRTSHYVAPYLMLSLNTLASDGVAVTEADIFWKREKADVEITTTEI